MLAKSLALITTLAGVVFAHGKPFPHTHVGSLHIEDLIIVLSALSIVTVGGALIYRHSTRDVESDIDT